MLNKKIALGAALAGAFALGALAVGYSSAQGDRNAPLQAATTAPEESASIETSFSALQEDEIRSLVRAYLLDNPEVIIEAVNLYSERQRVASEEQARMGAVQNIAHLLDPETSYVAEKKPGKAKVSVIEFYDYHCGYCKRASDLVKDLTESDDEVKVVFRELPLLRKESAYAAEMSLAARKQGKFLDLHFAMLDAKGTLTKERIHDLARKQGLDVKAMEAAIEKDGIVDMVADNHALAQSMGIDYTPAFIVTAGDGDFIEIVSGYQPDALREAIAEAKKTAG